MGALSRFVAVGTVLGLLYVASPAVAAASVVGEWKMDEPSGSTAFDSSGNGNNAALTNVTLGHPGSPGGTADADLDYSFGFNGHSSTMIIPKRASLAAGNAEVTVTMDIKTSVEPGTGDFDFDLWSKGGYQVELFPKKHVGGQARCKFIGSITKTHLQAGPDLADGQWHTITCHKDATTVSLTVGGTTFTQSVTIGTLKTGGKAWVGVGSNLTDYYNGQLDDLTVTLN
jgi:Concanavalin A-like lectin/glucanases superfamily